MPWRYQIWILKVAMSPLAHAQANENKPEKVNPTFSSSVGDFGRLFLSETNCLKMWSKQEPITWSKSRPKIDKKATSSWRAPLKKDVV